MTHEALRCLHLIPKPQEDCVEYVVALQTAMMAATAIVTLTSFLLNLL
jgi:hypothetical protein